MAMSFTYDDGFDQSGARRSIRKVVCTWTSDASGDATGTTGKIVGTLVKATTNPGSAAPTDDYDITLTDEDGVNILTACQSTLANRDTSNSEERYFLVLDAAGTPLAQSVHPVVCGAITVTVANAGDTKSGVVTLYLRD